MRGTRTTFVLVALASLAAASLVGASLVGCGDGAGPSGGDIAGTYTLDVDATADAMAKTHPNATADTAKAAKEMTRNLFKRLEMSITVKGDKTWEGTFKGGTLNGTRKGTWFQDGDKATLVTKEKDGKPADDPDRKMTVSDGTLTIEEGNVRVLLKRR